jgi:hypothetical protein
VELTSAPCADDPAAPLTPLAPLLPFVLSLLSIDPPFGRVACNFVAAAFFDFFVCAADGVLVEVLSARESSAGGRAFAGGMVVTGGVCSGGCILNLIGHASL